MQNFIKRDQFDFEIGYLTKSPCVECQNKSNQPQCHRDCSLLDKIQTTLAKGISTQASSYRS
ncbi:MAG: hypothetical protein ABIJ59_20145 [Pseudomonadota bacterium]